MSNIQPNRFQDISLRLQKETREKDAPGNGSEKAITHFSADTLELQNTLPLQTADSSGMLALYDSNLVETESTVPNETGANIVVEIQNEEEAVAILKRYPDILDKLDGDGDGLIHFDHLKQLAEGTGQFENAGENVRAAAQFYVDNTNARERWDAYGASGAVHQEQQFRATDSLLSRSYLDDYSPPSEGEIVNEDEAVTILMENPEILVKLDGDGDDIIHFDHLKQLAEGTGEFQDADPDVRAAAQFYVDNSASTKRWDSYGVPLDSNGKPLPHPSSDSKLALGYLRDYFGPPPPDFTYEEALNTLSGSDTAKRLLHAASLRTNSSLSPNQFTIEGVQALADGIHATAIAPTEEEISAAQWFINNPDQLKNLDPDGDGIYEFPDSSEPVTETTPTDDSTDTTITSQKQAANVIINSMLRFRLSTASGFTNDHTIFSRAGLEAMAAGTDGFEDATAEERAAAQYFLNNQEALSNLSDASAEQNGGDTSIYSLLGLTALANEADS
jgi:hypothetical protein